MNSLNKEETLPPFIELLADYIFCTDPRKIDETMDEVAESIGDLMVNAAPDPYYTCCHFIFTLLNSIKKKEE